MSFKLSIKNPPSGSKYWYADYFSGQVYSYYMDISVTWNCPYAANGATDLRIVFYDTSWKILATVSYIGPIYDGKEYQYDFAANRLSEVIPEVAFSSLGIKDYIKV